MAVLASKAARKSDPSSSYLPGRKANQKRGFSEMTESSSTNVPKKIVKLSGEERIKELEAQVRVLHEFIIDCGVAYEAPPSILKQLERYPGYEEILCSSLQKQILATWEPLYESSLLGTQDPNGTTEKISHEVCKYIPEIELLSRMPEGLGLSLKMIMFLGQHSYGSADHIGLKDGNRPSDALADRLLVDILRRLRAQDPAFKVEDEFDILRREAKRFRIHNNKQHWRQSLALIWSWIKPQNLPQEAKALGLKA